jgi:GMC oxidoreductase
LGARSGWPFSRREIQHFYERAQEVCGIGKFDYRAAAWETGTDKSHPWQTEKIESVVSQFGSSEIFVNVSQTCGEPRQPLRLLEQHYSEGLCGWSRLNGLERRFGEIGFHSLVEQSPDRSNRIMLQEQTDAFGQRKIKVLWRWNELDLRSIRQAQQIFREELGAAGIGIFIPVQENFGSQPRSFNSPHHFLGTTRMHDNPRNGVVDADCRVHEVRNLFIAGSSVFPTGGFANPTLTIVALALRLATHLQTELQSTPRIETNRTQAALG